MTSLLKTAVVAAVVTYAGLMSAHAAVIPFGTITGENGNDSRSWMNTVSGTFTDYATFTTTRTANFSASITNSFSTEPQFISDLTLSLYRGAIGSGTLVSSMVSTDPNDPPDTQRVKLKAFSQMAGNYYLQVSGTTADTPSYGGSFSISVSAVPIPSAAPMFGAALLALGAAGYGLKRRKATAA